MSLEDVWAKLASYEKGLKLPRSPAKNPEASSGPSEIDLPADCHLIHASSGDIVPVIRKRESNLPWVSDFPLKLRPPPPPPLTDHLALEKYTEAELETAQRFWGRSVPEGARRLRRVRPSPRRKTVEVSQVGDTIEIKEVDLDASTQKTAKDSTSLLRKPAPPSEGVRGKSANVPFRPGGLDNTPSVKAALTSRCEIDLSPSNYATCPPGWSGGMENSAGEEEPDHEPHVLGLNEADLMSDYAPGNVDYEAIIHERHQNRMSEKSDKLAFDSVFADDGVDPFEFSDEEESSDDEESEDSSESSDDSEGGSDAEKEDDEPKPAEESTPADTKGESSLKRSDSLDNLLLEEEDTSIIAKRAHAAKKAKSEVKWAFNETMDVSNFSTLVPNPAIDFPFELDVFQKQAVYHLENHESVFVAAHTSSGKTVVAEYAVALAQKHLTRTIYTSPIKALSNQKFREFKKTFGDENVGILTGDVSINPTAPCLIVTTEILRSMLYRGADLIRDIEWVIFDEVHYVNDLERGVVWEEVIIMLPDHVNMILLSATVPNTYEFADWIGRTKKKRIHVISTFKRPVPLEHYLASGGDLVKVVDHKGTFLSQGYKKAAAAFRASQGSTSSSGSGGSGGPSRGGGGGGGSRGGGRGGRGRGRGGQTHHGHGFDRARFDRTHWVKMIDSLKKKELLPCVAFAFSRNRCEDSGNCLTNTDLLNASEKADVHIFFEQAVTRLKGADRKLPQVTRMRDLLKRGIGIHHAGLLPIMKEVVEMLFSKGRVKILFATETFAMGVNMPAKSVIFNGLRKHDGVNFRDLLPGEYTQMSGRAGRRGLDPVGTVIVACWDKLPEEGELYKMILGKPEKLESQFRLTYNMILNLLRVEDFKVEDMIKRSFSEFHSQKDSTVQKDLLQRGEAIVSKLKNLDCLFGEPTIEDYYRNSMTVKKLGLEMRELMISSNSAQQALGPGRVVVVNHGRFVNSIGVIVRVTAPPVQTHIAQGKVYSTLVFDGSSDDSGDIEDIMSRKLFAPVLEKNVSSVVVDLNIIHIVTICKAKLQVNTVEVADLQSKEAIENVKQQLLRILEQHPNGPPAFDPVKDFKIKDIEFAKRYATKNQLLAKLADSKCARCPKLSHQYAEVSKQQKLKRKILNLKHDLSDQSLQLMPEFNNRVALLQRLNYINDEHTIQLKGRVACELNTIDELIGTELIFESFLTRLTPPEIVSILSTMVFQQKSNSEPVLTETLIEAKLALEELTMVLGQAQFECGIDISPKEYVGTLRYGMMEVVWEWARGMPFAEICELTDIPEGTIVRCIMRLDETCKDVRNAARVIGDSSLYAKMEEASTLIKRDIVFAASLYLT